MLNVFSPNLKTHKIYAVGQEQMSIMGRDSVGPDQLVHVFTDPVLVTDNFRIALLRPTLRDTIFSLFAYKPRTVEYAGVSVSWDDSYQGVWGPSIDTLLIAKAVNTVLKKYPDIRTAIEVGCGSGFLGKFILKKGQHITSVTFNDFNSHAIRCAKDNAQDSRAVYRAESGYVSLGRSNYDLIVCNPPYIPRPDSIEDNQYEGIGLLTHLIHHGQEYLNPGGHLIIGLSNLADKIVFDQPSKLNFTTLEEMDVPLKVNNVLNNKSWLSYLKDRNLVKNNHNGYEFWHHIKTIWAQNTQ